MSEPTGWQAVNGHAPVSSLLMYLEGELDGREANGIAEHLKDCWICRTECERLNRGMYVFVEYREQVLEPSAPSPPPARLRFSRRMREVAAVGPQTSLLATILSAADRLHVPFPRRVAWISGLSAVALIAIVILFPVFHPPALSAKEFLIRACSSSKAVTTGPRQVVYRKLRIRRGNRVQQQDVYAGSSTVAAQPPDLDPELANAMRLARIDRNNPLSANGFAQWRDALDRRTDTLSESATSLTLRTLPLDDGPVRSASLTVNHADWRPISEYVEFREGLPLEVTELAYEIREIPSVAQFETLPLAAPEIAVLQPHPTEAAMATEVRLDEAEVLLQEALHRSGADVREMPTLERTDREIRLRAFTQTAARKMEILEAVRDIPSVAAEVSDAESKTPLTAENAKLSPAAQPVHASLHTTSPPLAKALSDSLGGSSPASTYLVKEREAYLDILTNSSALKRLASLYPDEVWSRLSQDSRARLNLIAADHIGRIQTNASDYLGVVSPVLDDMIRQRAVAIPAPVQGANFGAEQNCAGWRTEAASIVEQIQRLQTSFRALFVVEQTDHPVSVPAEELLRESEEARRALRERLQRLCWL